MRWRTIYRRPESTRCCRSCEHDATSRMRHQRWPLISRCVVATIRDCEQIVLAARNQLALQQMRDQA